MREPAMSGPPAVTAQRPLQNDRKAGKLNHMTHSHTGEFNSSHVQRRFDRAAGTFASADFVHRAAADGLLQRLLPMTVTPGQVLDLGSALGAGGLQLAKRFRKTRILSVDLSMAMLQKARGNRGWLSKTREIQADARRLPLRTGSVDLVFANMLLPWIDDPESGFSEIARVLRKNGLFAFSTLGPSSFAELREAWNKVDDEPHVHRFADMHNVGDALVRAGLRDPVLDVDRLSVTYKDADALFADLRAAGARNCLSARRRSLTGRQRMDELRRLLNGTRQNGVLRLDLELVYGHAWGGGPPQAAGEYRLSPADIGRRRR